MVQQAFGFEFGAISKLTDGGARNLNRTDISIKRTATKEEVHGGHLARVEQLPGGDPWVLLLGSDAVNQSLQGDVGRGPPSVALTRYGGWTTKNTSSTLR